MLLVTAILPVFLEQKNSVVKAQSATSVPSDMLQYEWPSYYGDTSYGWFTAGGPGPTVGDYLWKSDLGQPKAAFNGLLFLTGGHVVDPYTGRSIYNTTYTGGRSGNPTKLDETRFYAGNKLFETATGNVLGTFDQSIPNYYDSELKMFWKDVQGGGVFNIDAVIQGWNFDFTNNATLAYTLANPNGWRAIDYQYGKIFCGSGFGNAMCFDGATGELLWETPLSGYLGYNGAFWDGIWIAAGQDGILYGIDTDNGEILWEFAPTGDEAFFSFWEDAGCISNGVLYSINTQHYTYALDVYTGELVWKWRSEMGSGYQIHPSACSGDENNPGLIVGVTGRRAGALGTYYSPDTHEMYHPEFVCLNQVTGQCEWKTNAVNVTSAGTGNAMFAYGNLYLTTYDHARAPTIIRDAAVCISTADRPYPSFHNDLANTGTGWTFSAPEKLDLNWIFEGMARLSLLP
jgi:outer membrane protein assembly factor BamB